jgi:phosphoglycolate phosphatase
MRADRTKAWMIGDTQMDIQSAKAAGVGHVAVSSGYETAESLRKHALTVKDNVLDAVLFLKEVHR